MISSNRTGPEDLKPPTEKCIFGKSIGKFAISTNKVASVVYLIIAAIAATGGEAATEPKHHRTITTY